MKKSNRFLAYILSLSMLLPIATVPAHAANIPVTTDEAVYVNMDYYGAITGNVVLSKAVVSMAIGNSRYGLIKGYEHVGV